MSNAGLQRLEHCDAGRMQARLSMMDAAVYCTLHENGNRNTVQGVKIQSEVTCGGILMRLHFRMLITVETM